MGALGMPESTAALWRPARSTLGLMALPLAASFDVGNVLVELVHSIP
jgi:hypothetical protein